MGERVLSDPEIRLFWHKVVEAPASRQTGLGLRLALLTGVRVGEVAGIKPSELEHMGDPVRAVWTIPKSRTKNGLAHVVPLAPMALEIVREFIPVTPGAYAAAMERIADDYPVMSQPIKPGGTNRRRRTTCAGRFEPGCRKSECQRIFAIGS